jgi:hypothetical protein
MERGYDITPRMSFRSASKTRTRNLEIPLSMLLRRPEMTAF